MTAIKHLPPSTYDLLDEEALIKEARVLARRRRRRGLLVITLVVGACIIFVGVDRFSSASSGRNDASAASASAALTCPRAHMKLLGVTAISGGLGHAGVVVRASVSSSATCAMRGYPTVGAGLSSHSTAMASDLRLGYLGGWATGAPTPRLSITSRPRVVSFTIQWTDGNGPTCPSVNAIQVTLPGSRKVLTARSMYEGGIGNTRFMGIYCSHLSVTPLVKGSSGSGS
jgi:hypothetical protein